MAKELYGKPLDKYEIEVMKIFNCDHNSWPICLYDYTYKNRIPQYLCFKSSQYPIELIENYMDNPNKGGYVEDCKYEDNDREGILMERGIHYCNMDSKFSMNFKLLY